MSLVYHSSEAWISQQHRQQTRSTLFVSGNLKSCVLHKTLGNECLCASVCWYFQVIFHKNFSLTVIASYLPFLWSQFTEDMLELYQYSSLIVPRFFDSDTHEFCPRLTPHQFKFHDTTRGINFDDHHQRNKRWNCFWKPNSGLH